MENSPPTTQAVIYHNMTRRVPGLSTNRGVVYWMSIEEAFAYYSPFATTKLIMELPDHDRSQSDQEDEVRF